MLALHDTALGRVLALEPRVAGEVSIYVCGPTVYDYPHVGHGRHALVYDILWRYLEWSGWRVRFVSNVTDIDDKIIARAQEDRRETDAVVAQFEEAWWAAVDQLEVRRPDLVPHATEFVPQMVALVERLLATGHAYETSDGVYFVSASVPDYGLLARQSLESLQAGARVEMAEEKRAAADFVLWKKAKPGEPTWPSPWGPGRPGWNTECVVMSLDLLGDDFDLHGGGQDLVFPHHENERAQAVALGRRFSRRWMHHGFVVDPGGEKMSKSLGNFTSLTDLLGRLGGDGRPLRLLVLQSHYRSPMTIQPDTVEAAVRGIGRLDEFARLFPEGATTGRGDIDEDATARFRSAMDDDLNTPVATAVLFDQVSAAHAARDRGDSVAAEVAARTARHLAAAVGLRLGSNAGAAGIPAAIVELAARRDAARAQRDWAASDALRDELIAHGYQVKDTPTGTVVHR